MILRAELAVELEAADYATAADHQRRLETFVNAMKAEFGDVSFRLRERRVLARDKVRAEPRTRLSTGNLNDYDDA